MRPKTSDPLTLLDALNAEGVEYKGGVQVGEGSGSPGVGVALAVGVVLADGVAVAVGVREGVRVGDGLGAATVTLGVGGATICTGQPFSA